MPFTNRHLITLILLISAALIAAGVFVLHHHCPATGLAFTQERRAFHRLKNRTALPQPGAFDERPILSDLVKPGEDRNRWSVSRAARIEGYVVSLAAARTELANCYCTRDIHIHIGLRPDAPPREHVVLEITPRMAQWASHQGWDWSEETLKRELLGHWCRFEGWLFFDSPHAGESENLAPGARHNWRATAWEIHPVTRIEVLR